MEKNKAQNPAKKDKEVSLRVKTGYKMAKKETKPEGERIEREYIINLRSSVGKVPIYRRTPKAVKSIKEFLARHMKVYDRDLNKIKIDKYLNEFLWARGIKNPQTRIKIKAVKEGGIVRAELSEVPEKLKFKILRENKRDEKASASMQKGKKEEKAENKEEAEKTEEEKKEKAEDEKEKKSAVVEAGKQMEKAAMKRAKHETKGKAREPKHEHRMSLQK